METTIAPCLLLLDLPPAALGGIDLLSFTISPRFRGIKELPPGFHFAFAGTSTTFSERHGLWFSIPTQSSAASSNVFIAKWDANAEALVAELDTAEQMRWRANLGSIWREGLTPYRQSTPKKAVDDPIEETQDWSTLTSAITPQLLARITGGDANHWYLSSASSARRDLEDIPGLKKDEVDSVVGEKELHFLPIDLKQTWREGATGRERTEAAQDRSWALENIIESFCTDRNVDEIIGELQFCFLMILTINNFSCLEQWRRILTLVFTCKAAVVKRADFFVKSIAALRLQLQHCKDAEGGLIDLTDEGGSLLKDLLARFRRGLDGFTGTGISEVADELDDLEDYLRQEHGWQFGGDFARSGMLELADGEQVHLDTSAYDEEDETGEFAPQIVELTPEQARMLKVEESVQGLHASLSRTSLIDAEPSTVVQSDTDDDKQDSEEEDQDLEDMDSRF